MHKSYSLPFAALGFLTLALVLTGCRSSNSSPPPAVIDSAAAPATLVRLNAGDVVQITFPGAPTLNTVERVRLDGNLLLPLVGEVPAAGKSPTELQGDLVKLYSGHLQTKEVLVVLASSSASIFVGGAVARPGRIPMERPMTVLDAIMEAGGFDPRRANVKNVSVIRQKDGKYTRQYVNLKPVLKGEDVRPFPLQPFDTVYVPEKIF